MFALLCRAPNGARSGCPPRVGEPTTRGTPGDPYASQNRAADLCEIGASMACSIAPSPCAPVAILPNNPCGKSMRFSRKCNDDILRTLLKSLAFLTSVSFPHMKGGRSHPEGRLTTSAISGSYAPSYGNFCVLPYAALVLHRTQFLPSPCALLDTCDLLAANPFPIQLLTASSRDVEKFCVNRRPHDITLRRAITLALLRTLNEGKVPVSMVPCA